MRFSGREADKLEQIWESKLNEMDENPKSGDFVKGPKGELWVIKKGGKEGSARISYDADGTKETIQRRNLKPSGKEKGKTVWVVGKQ